MLIHEYVEDTVVPADQVIFYRVEEFTTGKGPYRSDIAHACGIQTDDTGDHVGPDEDSGLKYYWNSISPEVATKHLFGFATMSQYNNWFRTLGQREDGHSVGGCLVVYLVYKRYLRVGKYQAMAHREYMTRVKTLNMHDFNPYEPYEDSRKRIYPPVSVRGIPIIDTDNIDVNVTIVDPNKVPTNSLEVLEKALADDLYEKLFDPSLKSIKDSMPFKA